MDEFALIDRFFACAGAVRDDVLLGIGDDGALTRCPAPGQALALVADTIVAGVHFPAHIEAAAVGYRALAVNLSDLAAMGADPAWALLAITLPAADPAWLTGFSEGLARLARRHSVALVGGDTTSGGTLTITVTAAGFVPPARALRRRGAAPGDLVCVTGTPGDAAAGLALLQEGSSTVTADPSGASTPAASLASRFLWPEPRVCCGRSLRGLASAAIDLSDGLLADAGKLGVASGVRLVLDTEALPCSRVLSAHAGDRHLAETLALTGGDDYELLFTVPAVRAKSLPPSAPCCGEPWTPIGRVESIRDGGEPGATALRDGRPITCAEAGYRHFT